MRNLALDIQTLRVCIEDKPDVDPLEFCVVNALLTTYFLEHVLGVHESGQAI
jgi:hypothetical protein